MLLKHDNLLNEFPNSLLTIFFPSSTTMNSVLSFGTKLKGRECHAAARCRAQSVSVFPNEESEEVACLFLQNMENFSTDDGRSRQTDVKETDGKV